MRRQKKYEYSDPREARKSEHWIEHMGQKVRVTIDEEGKRTTHFGGPAAPITTDRNGN